MVIGSINCGITAPKTSMTSIFIVTFPAAMDSAFVTGVIRTDPFTPTNPCGMTTVTGMRVPLSAGTLNESVFASLESTGTSSGDAEETIVGVGVGVGVGVTLGVGEALGVGETLGVGVTLGEGVALGVGDAVATETGVEVGVGVGVGEAVGVGVGVGVGAAAVAAKTAVITPEFEACVTNVVPAMVK